MAKTLVQSERYAPVRMTVERSEGSVWLSFENDLEDDGTKPFAVMVQAVEIDNGRVIGSWVDSTVPSSGYEAIKCSNPKVTNLFGYFVFDGFKNKFIFFNFFNF